MSGSMQIRGEYGSTQFPVAAENTPTKTDFGLFKVNLSRVNDFSAEIEIPNSGGQHAFLVANDLFNIRTAVSGARGEDARVTISLNGQNYEMTAAQLRQAVDGAVQH